MRTRALPSLSIGALLASAGACAMPSELPGVSVGKYAIEGELTENSCGSQAVPAKDPLKFNVEVREHQGEGVWLQGAPPGHRGELEASGEFAFKLESTYDVRTMPPEPVESLIYEDIEKLADPSTYDNLDRPAAQPCRLRVTERIEGTLVRDSRPDAGTRDAGSAAAKSESADLIGENEVAIGPASGDCSIVLAQRGGPFLALPCRVHYDLDGQLLE